MTSYINLFPINHSKMASYERRFANCIFAIFAKALIGANKELDFDVTHCVIEISKLRARSGLFRVHRPFSKKQGSNVEIFLPCYY